MYDYLFAGNGVFIRAVRPQIEVIMPVELYQKTIRGLPSLAPQLKFGYPKVPEAILRSIMEHGCRAKDEEGRLIETLFYLDYREDGWRCRIPKQFQSVSSCRSKKLYQSALIELHSHGNMSAFFSDTDDAEENGFRIYSVIGKLKNNYLEIKVRVGLFGYFWNIPADSIFELPYFFTDASNKAE
jgi:PRTRC genetic system protein A